MIQPIAPWGNPILSAKCERVSIGPDLLRLCDDLQDTAMGISPNGLISLSAPQLGYAVKVIFIGPGLTQGAGPLTMINPLMLSHSEELQYAAEQCASCPGIEMNIQRYANCRVEALNTSGDVFVVNASGLLAQAIQHELQHLRGETLLECTNTVKRKYLGDKLKEKYHGDRGMMIRISQKDLLVNQ